MTDRDRPAADAASDDCAAASAATLRESQLKMHAAGALPAVVVGIVGATLLTSTLRAAIAPHLLACWLALLAGVLVLRAGLPWLQRRRPAEPHVMLLRYRSVALLNGLVWGSVAWLPGSMTEAQGVLVVLMAGLCAGAMTLTLFDLVAGLLFVLPALLPVAARMLVEPARVLVPTLVAGAMLLTLLGLFCLTAQRVRAAGLRRAQRQQDAASARHAQRLLTLIFDHAGEGICVFDRDLRLAAWNDRCLDFTRAPRDALRVGMPLRECLLNLARAGDFGAVDPELEADRRLAFWSDNSRADVTRRTLRDGRSIELRRSPMPDGGFVLVYVDITERLAHEDALAAKQRLLSALLENTHEGFWFIDNEGRTTDTNPAMCRLLGRTREEMLGHSIFEYVDEANAALFRVQMAARDGGVSGGYAIDLQSADGSTVHCYNNATPIFDGAGRKIGAVGLIADISEQRRGEQRVLEAGLLLAQKSHVLEVTLESLAQGVLSLDAEGRTSAYNQRLLELLQLPEALLQTRPTMRVLTQYQVEHGQFGAGLEHLSDAGRDGLARFLQGDMASLARQYRRRRADGVVLDVDTHFAPDGSIVRTYTDVTASVKAEQTLRESESRFRTMADGAPALIWQADGSGRALWFNQRWLEYTGRTMDAELALDWARRMHADDSADCHASFQAAVDERRPYAIEFRLRRADGSWCWIADNGIPHFAADGTIEGYISYGWDVTERKAAERALRAAKDDAERANRAKSAFLSRMSHELRTPMNAILGFGQLLESDPSDPLSAAQRTRMHEMMRGGRHLLELIDQVLDVSRIEGGKLALKRQPVALAPLIEECLELARPLAQQHGIHLLAAADAGAGLVALADPRRLRQVLLNLLSNAIKYNRENGDVVVACSADGDSVQLEVTDRGAGLDAAQQRRLFQPFERLDADRTGIQGSGIGLALSQRLVALMQGRIGVDSTPGVGSTFWLRLARSTQTPALPPATDAKALPTAAGDDDRRTVLYIEDNPVNQILMEGMLAQRPGIRLLVAGVPATGLALAAQARPELILLDIQLPGIDGFEVLRRLRLQPATRAVPVIAVSANATASDIEAARQAGFDAYLTKPIDMRELLERVDHALGETIS